MNRNLFLNALLAAFDAGIDWKKGVIDQRTAKARIDATLRQAGHEPTEDYEFEDFTYLEERK